MAIAIQPEYPLSVSFSLPLSAHLDYPANTRTECLFLSLRPLFEIDLLCFQRFPASFAKGGGVVCPRLALNLLTLTLLLAKDDRT